jgi:hypothetical protein
MTAQLNKMKFGQTALSNERVLQQREDKARYKHLLYGLLPKSGHICVAELLPAKSPGEKAPMRYEWFARRKDAIKFLMVNKYDKNQIFVAQASFTKRGSEWKGRKQIEAAFIKNFFMDIDNGEDKPYATRAKSKKALLTFLRKTGLPDPAIVNSGNGYYAHWTFTYEVPVDVWTPEAKKLQKLVRAIEPGLDYDNLIKDCARVLRPVGSIHRKDPDKPKKVTLLQDCEPIEFEEFVALIDKALAALPAKPATAMTSSPNKLNAQFNNNADQEKNASAITIAEKCAALAEMRDARGNVAEPFWHACIVLLRHCTESPSIIHEWSSGHPGYSHEETDAKIAKCKTPPTTCEHFAGLCSDLCGSCEHKGKIKTPFVLGYTKPTDIIPDFVDAMNKDRFVGCIGGKTVVCREIFDEALCRFFLETSSFQDTRNYFNNQKVIVGMNKDKSPITSPLGNAWLDHEFRRQYMDIRMLPEGCSDEKVYNLFRGFAVEPKKGSWTLMRKHIKYVICSGDKKLYKYVIRWLARMIQEPWTPGEVALVLQGGKGVGKGMLGNAICRIMGQHACHVMNVKHVTGDFNAHLEDCIFLFADEAFWAGDKAAEGVLKGMITEPTILIVRKYCDGRPARNMLHVFMASNNDWVVPASKDERRYCVLKVSDRHRGDIPYFAALAEETDNGGLAAMLYYLQNMDLSKFEVRAVPKTLGLAEQKLQSLDNVTAWWYQKLKSGDLLNEYSWSVVPTQALYDDYVTSVQKLGGNIRRVTDTAFGIQLHKVLPDGWPKKYRQTSGNGPGRANHYEFPSLKVCRKKFAEVLGDDSLDWEQ